jgi:nicotinamidase-related amidase
MLNFVLQSQKITYRDKFRIWETVQENVQCPAAETAVVIVDMWDQHWSYGASYRGAILASRVNEMVIRAREKGCLIVHAPSDTMDFYEGTEGRNRFLTAEKPASLPQQVSIKDYPSPIDDSDGGSDTIDQYSPNTGVWKRQTDKIIIDHSHDIVCGDEGDRLYAYLTAHGITRLIYAGVHTNMCILHRSFAIKNMLRLGFKTALVRDLTDAMYNPERPPYVGHDEGTALVVSYIEKFYCPTIHSSQL